MNTLQRYGIQVSEKTVCMGVGSDVCCTEENTQYVYLWKASAIAGMQWHERVVLALEICPPHVTKALANAVILQQRPVTVDYMEDLLTRTLCQTDVVYKHQGAEPKTSSLIWYEGVAKVNKTLRIGKKFNS